MTPTSAHELRIRWQGELLQIKHLPSGEDVWIGDDADGPVAFVLPCARARLRSMFSELSFPQPEAGKVFVTYTLDFQPN